MKKAIQTILPLSFLVIGFNVAFAQGRWDTLKTKNPVAGRSECGMAASSGKLYLVGGDGTLAVEVFDPASVSWTKKTDAPVSMNHLQAVAFDNKIYILDAFSGGGFPDQTPMTAPYIYDIDKDAWTIGGTLASERRRAAAGAAVYNGKLYLVAGITHGHSSGTNAMFDRYDPQTGQWTALPDAPHIRDHCSATVVGDKLYVTGGRNTSYHEANNFMSFFSKTVLEVDCYDFKTEKWSTLKSKLPLGSGGGAVVNLNGMLYYMGGERATDTEPNAPRKNTFYLDPFLDDSWKSEADLNFGRNGMSATVVNGKIYAFGGAGGGPGGPPPNGGPHNPGQPSSADRTPGPPPNRMTEQRPSSPIEVFTPGSAK